MGSGRGYLKLQLTGKNAVMNAVVSWVVDTWKLHLTCKNAVINAVVYNG